MAAIVNSPTASRHRLSLDDVKRHQAKAALINLEQRKTAIGKAISRARALVGWTQNELAGEIAKVLGRDTFDQAQIARWEAGKERPHFDVLMAVEQLEWPLIQCLAALDEANEIVTEIRRRA